jgi:hypothetical protein
MVYIVTCVGRSPPKRPFLFSPNSFLLVKCTDSLSFPEQSVVAYLTPIDKTTSSAIYSVFPFSFFLVILSTSVYPTGPDVFWPLSLWISVGRSLRLLN